MIKPVSDFIFAMVFIVLASPLYITVSFLLYFLNSHSVFFIQPRPGINGHVFNCIKFKTMNDKKDENGNLLPASQRLTTIGRFLRRTSIDEIPQFINVLKGDMSLIGPRPLLVEYLPLYNEEQNRRHEVKPGITGLAQVKGRNEISWNEKFEMDVWYVDHISLPLDAKIFWLTVIKSLKGEGVDFKGSSSDTLIEVPFRGNI